MINYGVLLYAESNKVKIKVVLCRQAYHFGGGLAKSIF
jgi:hypothetical protein